MKTISACLWFDGVAEEAARFYVSVFPEGKILEVTYSDDAISDAGGVPVGAVLAVTFELMGMRFMGLNGGPMFKLSEAVSFMIPCETQAELDHFWEKLTEGGKELSCGWVTDKFGLTWQVFPASLEKMINDPDPEKGARVRTQMLSMSKLDFGPLQDAYDGK